MNGSEGGEEEREEDGTLRCVRGVNYVRDWLTPLDTVETGPRWDRREERKREKRRERKRRERTGTAKEKRRSARVRV